MSSRIDERFESAKGAENWLNWFCRRMDLVRRVSVRFVELLAAGRAGEPTPKGMKLREYWNDEDEVEQVFRAACTMEKGDEALVNEMKRNREALLGTLRCACETAEVSAILRQRLESELNEI